MLNSDTAIEMNRMIMRAFVTLRQLIQNPPVNEVKELQKGYQELRQQIEDILKDQNDINEDTRIQLELINESIAELHVKNKALNKPRNPIGFKPQYRQPDDEKK